MNAHDLAGEERVRDLMAALEESVAAATQARDQRRRDDAVQDELIAELDLAARAMEDET